MNEEKVQWLLAEECDPPHAVTHPEKLEALVLSLRNCWNGPALLGYKFEGRIQLISGSHRWTASQLLGERMPVFMLDYNYVQCCYGMDTWQELMNSAPIVREPSLYDLVMW